MDKINLVNSLRFVFLLYRQLKRENIKTQHFKCVLISFCRFYMQSEIKYTTHLKALPFVHLPFAHLPTSSAHPRHNFKSITTGEIIRHIRNYSNENELTKHIVTLKRKLINRGYNKNETECTISEVKQNVKRCNTLSIKRSKWEIPPYFSY